MSQSYHDGTPPVKSPCLQIPLEVSQDSELSDAAILLFGEIFGLQLAYGQCIAKDEHFMERRRKSRSSIQAQLKELRLRGHITAQTRFKDRVLIVAERYMPCPENLKDTVSTCPENRNGAHPACPENRNELDESPGNETEPVQFPGNSTHKTPESLSLSYNLDSNLEDKTQTPESSGIGKLHTPIDLSRFSDTDRAWMLPFLASVQADPGYASAVAAARQDVIEMALLQALKAKKDDKIKESVLGIIRSVLKAHGDCPPDYVAGRVGKLRAALGVSQNVGPKSFQRYRQAWTDEPDAPKVKAPKISRVRPEHIDGVDTASDAEDPAQAYRATLYLNDTPMLALADAALAYTPIYAPDRSADDIEASKRGVAGLRAALEAAGQKPLEDQKREAAGGGKRSRAAKQEANHV